MATLRHEFYETDEKLTVSVFDKGADPAQVSVKFLPRSVVYKHGEKELSLEPLKGQIDTDKSDYTVGKVKIEIRLVKMAGGRWGAITGDSPDPLASFPSTSSVSLSTSGAKKPAKNWDGITSSILEKDKSLTSDEDPNVGGDSTVNEFFQKLFADADEDTRRAMMKSYQESGGTTLSTNWDEVKKSRIEVKPPEGSEWKKWAA